MLEKYSMTVVNIHEAKTHFSKLIASTLKGDEVIIARGGKPIIKLIPYTEEVPKRHGGQFKGIIKISEDFDDPLPAEYLKLFYEGEDDTK